MSRHSAHRNYSGIAHAAYHTAKHLYKHRKAYGSVLDSVRKNIFKPMKGEEPDNHVEMIQDKLALPVHGSGVVEHIRDDLNGNQYVSLTDQCSGHFKKRKLDLTLLFESIFPRVNVRRRAYGTALSGTVSGAVPGGPQGLATTNGIQRSFSCVQSTCSIVELLHLPVGAHQLQATGTLFSQGANGSTTYALRDLMGIAKDSSNFGPLTAAVSSVNANSTLALTTGPLRYNNLLQYDGGKTNHYFENVNNVEVHMEFYVCRPKTHLPTKKDPLSLYYCDLAAQVFGQVSTTQTQAGGVPVGPAVSNSIAQTIRPSNHLIHSCYLVEKPKKIVLKAGGRVKFSVNHPAFEIENTPFNGPVTGTAGTDFADQYAYSPMCSVFLIVKFYGGVVSNDVTSGTITAVTNAAVTLVHTQDEYHNIRGGVNGISDQRIIVDEIADTIAAGQATFINPVTDKKDNVVN